jgi:hypothetical protein
MLVSGIWSLDLAREVSVGRRPHTGGPPHDNLAAPAEHYEHALE